MTGPDQPDQPDRAEGVAGMLRDITEAVAVVAARMLGLPEAERPH